MDNLRKKQTRFHSLLESINAAAFAAPTAIGLHKTMLWIFGDCSLITSDCNDLFLSISWFSFFLHSIGWKYVIRRIHEKYNVELNPWYMIKTLKRKVKDLICCE